MFGVRVVGRAIDRTPSPMSLLRELSKKQQELKMCVDCCVAQKTREEMMNLDVSAVFDDKWAEEQEEKQEEEIDTTVDLDFDYDLNWGEYYARLSPMSRAIQEQQGKENSRFIVVSDESSDDSPCENDKRRRRSQRVANKQKANKKAKVFKSCKRCGK